MGEAHFVAKAAFDVGADRIEELRTDRLGDATFGAVDVFPRPADGECVEPGAVTEVDVVHQPVALEDLEIPIDGRHDEVQGERDLLGRERSGGSKKRIQHALAGGGQAQSACAQHLDCVVNVFGGEPRHVRSARHERPGATRRAQVLGAADSSEVCR